MFPSLPVPGSTCGIPPLNSEVTATPNKASYQIGDRVSLSCPAGSELEGEVSEILCSPSLQWSPSPADAHCKAGTFIVEHVVNKSQINRLLFPVMVSRKATLADNVS